MLFSRQGSAAVALASLLLSPGVMAQLPTTTSGSPGGGINGAFCRAATISDTAKVQQDGYTNLWLNVGAYVCGDEDPVVVIINETATDIAIAIAEAFAEVSLNCFAEGNAEVRAMGYAIAQERAVALGTAVTEIFAEADVCGECNAAISALSVVTEELISEAVVEAWNELYLFSDQGTSVSEISTVTSSVIVSTIATVLSEITGILRAGVDGDCSIEIINTAQVGPFLARCELVAFGVSEATSTDAIAIAGAEAGAYACDGDIAVSEVDVIAQATATAVASAISEVYVFCETRGGDDTFACGLTEVEVRAVAFAQAEAFAFALAEAVTCDCNVSVSAEVSVWDSIWAEAAVNAYAETCSVGTGTAFDSDFQFAFESRMLVATARALASAVAIASEEDGNECRASVDVCASTSPQCVEINGFCGGTNLGSPFTLPCCDVDSTCIVWDEARFVCRSNLLPIPSTWDGSIATCTLPQPPDLPVPDKP